MRRTLELVAEARKEDPERAVQDLMDTVLTASRKLAVAESAARVLSRQQGREQAAASILKHLDRAQTYMGKAMREATDLRGGD